MSSNAGNNLEISLFSDYPIFNKNGDIDGTKFSKVFSDILFENSIELAYLFLDQVIKNESSKKISNRINTAKNQLKEIESFIKISDKKIKLDIFDNNKITEIFTLKHLDGLDEGFYQYINDPEKKSSFKTDFSNSPIDLKKKLLEHKFDREILKFSPIKFRIIKNPEFFTFNSNFYSVINFEKKYDRYNAARLAKLCKMNLYKESSVTKKRLKEVIVLPIEHTSKNYFHHLTEMIYGLSYVKNFPDNIPIIYTEDTFDILKYLCEAANISYERLIPFKDMDQFLIDKAYHFSPMNFLWDVNFFKFFNELNINSDSDFRIYIDNVNEKKSFKNKEKFFEKLRELDFLIIHAPNNLKMEKLIKLFQKASIVICQSDILLTNTAFMKPESHLIEIFDEKNINPDFYLRTRHNDIYYSCIFSQDDELDFDNLEKLVIKHLCQKGSA